MKAVEIVYRYDRDLATARPRPVDAQAALIRLDEGSRSVAELLDSDEDTRRVIPVDPSDLGLSADGAPAQRPFAAVLGCSDARVPIELIFNAGPNDLFVVRVAGNGIGADGLGSLRYAAEHLGESLKLVVVLGHSGCGAVTGAVDVFLDPRGYLELAGNHALRSILDRLLVVVHAAGKRMAAVYGADVVRHPRYREALVETAVVSNAALAAYTVEHELGESGALRAAYGVWLLESREIWAPRAGSGESRGLAHPPSDFAGFAQFADAVVGSSRIAAMLA